MTRVSFYFHEIHNFKVIDRDRGYVGILSCVLETAGQRILKIDYNGEEILVPLHDDFIERLDRQGKTLYLKTPQGLIDLYIQQN